MMCVGLVKFYALNSVAYWSNARETDHCTSNTGTSLVNLNNRGKRISNVILG